MVEVFVLEALAIDGLSASAVSTSEIATLDDIVRVNSVQSGAFVVQLVARQGTHTFLASA